MFASAISSWRNLKIMQVKGESIGSKSKPKLFEDAIDYIATSKSTPQELISEIMGFSETRCEAFRKLSIDNGLFFYEKITKEIIYLLAACFLKQVDQKYLALNNKIEPDKLKEWLTRNGYDCVAKEIEDKCLNTISLKDEKIFFSRAYKSIKLTTLQIDIDSIQWVKHTNRIRQLGIEDIYSNHNHRCLGATNYWLLTIANSYKKSYNQRQELKNEYIKSLETEQIRFSYDTVTHIKNIKTGKFIDTLHKKLCINDNFNQIQDVYTTNLSLYTDLFKLFELMQINQLSQLYVQMITQENAVDLGHALGLAIISKGVVVKILVYDPNDKNSYMSRIINPVTKNIRQLAQLAIFFKQIHSFKKEDNAIATLLRCYSFKIPLKQQQKFSKIVNNIEVYKAIKDPAGLLRLGIITNNHELVQLAVNTYGARSEDCIMLAVTTSCASEMVKLLTELVSDEAIKYVDQRGYTPLCNAVAGHNIEFVNILLDAEAKLNLPISDKLLYIARVMYPNKIIYNLLLRRMKK